MFVSYDLTTEKIRIRITDGKTRLMRLIAKGAELMSQILAFVFIALAGGLSLAAFLTAGIV